MELVDKQIEIVQNLSTGLKDLMAREWDRRWQTVEELSTVTTFEPFCKNWSEKLSFNFWNTSSRSSCVVSGAICIAGFMLKVQFTPQGLWPADEKFIRRSALGVLLCLRRFIVWYQTVYATEVWVVLVYQVERANTKSLIITLVQWLRVRDTLPIKNV